MEQKAVHGRELGDYVAVIRRRWFVVLVSMAICLGGGLAYLQVAPKTYVSTAKVLVTGTSDASVAEGSRTTDAINLDTEAQLVKSADVAGLARTDLGSPLLAIQLARRVSVSVPPNTTVLDIAFADSTKKGAAAGANAFAEAYLANRQTVAEEELQKQKDALKSGIDSAQETLAEINSDLEGATGDDRADLLSRRATVTATIDSLNAERSALDGTVISGGRVLLEAQEPGKATDPNPMLVLPSALFLGLLLGLALALWRERVDRRIHTNSDIDRVFGLTPLTTLRVVIGGGVGRDSRHYDVRALYHSLRANGPEAAEVVLVVAPDSPTIAGGICRALGVAAARSGALTTYVSNEKATPGAGPRASGGVLRTMNYRDADLVYEGEINAERLQSQISTLRSDNDFVVLGLPSNDPTVDLPMLCRHVDVVLALVHLGHATRTSVADTLRSLKTARARTVFAVSVDMRRQSILTRGHQLSDDGFVEESEPPSDEGSLGRAS